MSELRFQKTNDGRSVSLTTWEDTDTIITIQEGETRVSVTLAPNMIRQLLTDLLDEYVAARTKTFTKED